MGFEAKYGLVILVEDMKSGSDQIEKELERQSKSKDLCKSLNAMLRSQGNYGGNVDPMKVFEEGNDMIMYLTDTVEDLLEIEP